MVRSSLSATLLAGAALATVVAAPSIARAEQPAPVEVAIKLPPPPRRVVLVEWNPLPTFTIGRLSANVVITPVDHHALIVSPFYAWATTNGINTYDSSSPGCSLSQPCQTTLPVQHFEGFGGELGYRYYFGVGGPRGFFLGPSLILGSFTATPQAGAQVQYLQWGLAADAGYQVIVADSVAISLGAGVQYTGETKTIPNQQFPAELYANPGVRPRLLLSLGWAF
jgi:hypothetical protein